MTHPTTCAKNASQHPGKVLLELQCKRCTKAEITAAKKKEELTLEQVEQGVRAGLAAVAAIEDKQVLEDGEASLTMPPPSQCRLVHRMSSMRTVPDSEEERGKSVTASEDGDAVADLYDDEPSQRQGVIEPQGPNYVDIKSSWVPNYDYLESSQPQHYGPFELQENEMELRSTPDEQSQAAGSDSDHAGLELMDERETALPCTQRSKVIEIDSSNKEGKCQRKKLKVTMSGRTAVTALRKQPAAPAAQSNMEVAAMKPVAAQVGGQKPCAKVSFFLKLITAITDHYYHRNNNMLYLTETTLLFYRNLRPTKSIEPPNSKLSGIKSWCSKVIMLEKESKKGLHGTSSLSEKGSSASSFFNKTTRSSCTSVPVSVQKGPISRDTQDTEAALQYQMGGLEDKLETDKRDHALAGKKRGLSSVSSVKIEKTTDVFPVKRAKTETIAKTRNANLPEGCLEGGRWHSVFVPTYEKWAASQKNPWSIEDSKAIPAMQAIWDVIFPDIPYTITPNGPVYRILGQRVSEWRGSFGSAAAVIVEHFFASDPDSMTHTSTANYVGDSASEHQELFRSTFILQMFASHLNSISGAVEVKALRAAGVPVNSSDVQKFPPVGALALSAAAVEHIFTMWAKKQIMWDENSEGGNGTANEGKASSKVLIKPIPKLNKSTGKETASHALFSDTNWGQVTRYYCLSIQKLKQDSIEDIVQKAKVFARIPKSAVSSSVDNDSEDPCACLVDV
ncbi:hypothetical protein SERLA73DRAFT_156243 [Serpula lacrymans var. lacrymans S7.3]|uniref:Uncharacterized protein n=2 Tax=Serpula lacrymans var. lacrymans TaxID=341189 RepID=F8QDL7_SERL3|nr:uncharacterized protein SERLADRAFT_411948 [Serpula lacrymans var. lacrymans S7.9]EGN93688.1 hypothetical protein SERLA73DRAFT_156243 [Serpula lacrymans var. lacrymans S7.3]EGO19058.1 hypothetical protein SERLADRAFT_411948 [Serpula lacrymans var. lacrymans S7.9]